VANTHLDHRSEGMRRRSAGLIARWLSRASPTLLCGDFNESPAGPAVATLLAAGLRDPHRHLGDRGPAAATYQGFSGAGEGPRIDLILVSSHWECRQAHIIRRRSRGRLPSDHWPVVADLEPAARHAGGPFSPEGDR
jgi:endonuclease/exonuclease/phosphatase family metal-dependent hydrolase